MCAGGPSNSTRQVVCKPFFSNYEKVLRSNIDQTEGAKLQHERSDARARRTHHLGQFFVRDSFFDSRAAGIRLAELARQEQQRLALTAFTIYGGPIRDR